VVANGGAESRGLTDPANSNSTGGAGGSGAKVTAIFPVSAGQVLTAVVGRAGNNADQSWSGWPDGGNNGFGQGQGGGSSFVTNQPLVAFTGCKDIATSHLDRNQMLVLAGGGGGGGGGNTFGSGGNGGNAGANSDFSGQSGSTAYGLSTDCGNGGGGGFYGGAAPFTSASGVAA